MNGYLDEVPVSFELLVGDLALLNCEPLVCVQVHVIILIPVVEVRMIVVLLCIIFSFAWFSNILLLILLFDNRF